MDSVVRLDRDLAASAALLSDDEARFLVDAYYSMQGNRLRSENQVRALSKTNEPHGVLSWFSEQDRLLENQVLRALDKYSASKPLGDWARSVVGVGPVIAAGLLAHIDINKAPTAGHIWRFAGLDPTVTWEKGKRRPWNATLKTLCWKIGESFVKFQNLDGAVYGKIFAMQKAIYVQRNENGDYTARSAEILANKNFGKTTEAYKAYIQGRFPPAHIHAMARRYAVKLFLSHYHEMGYKLVLGKEPPLPYPIAILGHAHKIEPQT